MELEDFRSEVNWTVRELIVEPREALIVHHDDADSLCRVAIIKRAYNN